MDGLEHIRLAASGLDNAKDGDWTEGGKPSLSRVKQLAKDNTITQEQLDAAVPDMVRVKKGKKSLAVIEEEEEGHKYDPAVSGVMMIALERGYYAGAIREEGEVFPFTGIPGRWMREASKEEIAERNRAEQDRQKLSRSGAAGLWANEVAKR